MKLHQLDEGSLKTLLIYAVVTVCLFGAACSYYARDYLFLIGFIGSLLATLLQTMSGCDCKCADHQDTTE